MTILSVVVEIFGFQVGSWHIIAALSFPISAMKQIVSVVQMVTAMSELASADVVTRAHQRDQHS